MLHLGTRGRRQQRAVAPRPPLRAVRSTLTHNTASPLPSFPPSPLPATTLTGQQPTLRSPWEWNGWDGAAPAVEWGPPGQCSHAKTKQKERDDSYGLMPPCMARTGGC